MRPPARSMLILVLAMGCAPTDAPPVDAVALPAPDAAPWVAPAEAPPFAHPFFEAHPALTDVSSFGQRVEGPPASRPSRSERGLFGIGNGNAFATLGLVDPVNTLHSMVGPIYRKQSRFFGDTALLPVLDGDTLDGFDVEHVARPRGTAVVVTRSERDDGVWTFVDVAPRPEGVADSDVPPVLVRFVLFENLADTPHAAGVAIDSVDDLALDDGVVIALAQREDGATDPRVLGHVPVGATLALDDDARWRLDLGTVAPGGTAQAALVYATAADRDALDTVVDDLEAADLEDWLDDTVAWWRAFSAEGMQLEVDDPVLVDLIDAGRTILRVQQSAAGGVNPMNRYTSAWLRDTIGPARAYSRLGLFDEAEAALTYLQLCHTHRRDYGNSCQSGLLPEDVTWTVDWDALGPFEGRTRAEGPSYVPLAWRALVQWTGDDTPVVERWSYLRRAVSAQEVTADGLQRWSGDETFRLAMNVALGELLEFPLEEQAWSSNSAHVYLPAARFLAEVADAHDLDGADTLRDRADLVQAGLEATFLAPEGYFSALVWMDDDRTPNPLPFEDSALKAIWAGAYAPDDPVAVGALDALVDAIGQGDGLLASLPDDTYAGNPDFAQGVGTGMLPGFTLWNLSATGHPEVTGARNEVRRFASPSGAYQEGVQILDRGALHLIYDAGGATGDIAARYRPWETGIVLDALLYDVVGAEPLGTRDAPALRLRPRMPNGQRHLTAGPIAFAGAEVAMTLTWDDGWVLTVENTGDVAAEIHPELPLGVWDDVDVDVEDGEIVERPFGERMAVFPPQTLAPGAARTVAVRNPAP